MSFRTVWRAFFRAIWRLARYRFRFEDGQILRVGQENGDRVTDSRRPLTPGWGAVARRNPHSVRHVILKNRRQTIPKFTPGMPCASKNLAPNDSEFHSQCPRMEPRERFAVGGSGAAWPRIRSVPQAGFRRGGIHDGVREAAEFTRSIHHLRKLLRTVAGAGSLRVGTAKSFR